jgi:hypothetical protein
MNAAQEDSIFWDRLQDMPDAEAVQELNLRRDDLVLQKAVLQKAKVAANLRDAAEITRAVMENDSLITKINSEAKQRNIRMDRRKWKDSVRAVFGDEGVEKCLIWMETQR